MLEYEYKQRRSLYVTLYRIRGWRTCHVPSRALLFGRLDVSVLSPFVKARQYAWRKDYEALLNLRKGTVITYCAPSEVRYIADILFAKDRTRLCYALHDAIKLQYDCRSRKNIKRVCALMMEAYSIL